VGGAADRAALALGNALVGNPPEAAALEVCLSGPVLEAGCDLACVVYGAPFDLFSDRRKLTPGTTFTLHSGEQLHIDGTPAGMRAYLCLRGGLREKVVLGSRSTFEPLAAGAELPCLPGTIAGRFVRPPQDWNRERLLLRVLDGPQADWFRADEFYPQAFTVTPESNRMGLRLRAEPLTMPARELVSEPVCPGAVQVTSNGQCIILGVDGQTIGGYPKVAQVISADLDKLGQLRPHEDIRFERVGLEEARTLYGQKQREIQEWLRRLHVAEVFP
jgi:antagonist of KipI